MFKKALVLVLIVILASQVFSVRLIEPFSKDLSQGDFVGTVSPGSTLTLILSKELGKFDTLTLSSGLPNGFDAQIKPDLESIKLLISVPQNAVAGKYDLIAQLSGKSATQDVDVYFNVEKGLLDASPNNNSQNVLVGQSAAYEFSFVNNSDADVNFVMTPEIGISSYYFEGQTTPVQEFSKVISVAKKKSAKGSITIIPSTEGQKFIKVSVLMGNTGKSTEFSLRLNASPTIKSKLDAVFFGLPFYSFSMLPNYFLNGLFSMALK